MVRGHTRVVTGYDITVAGTTIDLSFATAKRAVDSLKSGLDAEISPSEEAVNNEKTGEDLKSLYIAESADNKDLVYVSTSSQLPDEWTEDMKSTNKIYSYNTKTNDLKMLYEEKEGRLLRTLGVDGTKLVLLYDGIDNSPAPCFSVWLDGLDYGYLDIENPSELKDYTVPDYQKELAKKEQKECELSMEQ